MNKIITLLVATFFITVSCSTEGMVTIEEQNALIPLSEEEGTSRRDEPDPSSECEITVDLIAGQHINVGEVTLSYDYNAQTISITYTLFAGWTMDESHVWVGVCEERPANNPGNPLIGHFPYAENHAAGTYFYTYVLDMATEGLDAIGCAAMHAAVSGPNGESETAWADGLPYGGQNWAMYLEYDFTTCQ